MLILFSIVQHNICLTLIFYSYTGSFGISDIHCMIFHTFEFEHKVVCLLDFQLDEPVCFSLLY